MRIEHLASGSPDCPLIRLFAFGAADVTQLRNHVDGLASGLIDRVELDALPFVEPVGECHLALAASAQAEGVVRTAGLRSFECRLTREGWSRVGTLLEPFSSERAEQGFEWLDETSGTSLLLSRSGSW